MELVYPCSWKDFGAGSPFLPAVASASIRYRTPNASASLPFDHNRSSCVSPSEPRVFWPSITQHLDWSDAGGPVGDWSHST